MESRVEEQTPPHSHVYHLDDIPPLPSPDDPQHKAELDQVRRRWSKKRGPNTQKSAHKSSRDEDDSGLTSPLSLAPSEPELGKQKSRYFDEAFAAREPYNTPRHRVNQDAIVVVEIKTNIVILDHFLVVSDLAFNLAQIFQRPQNSILLSVEHSACLIFGISNEPAYLATVSSVPYLIAPITNQRNTVLLQNHLHETLGIPSSRGVVKFIAIPEENFATNGSTIKDEIERLEQRTSNDGSDGIIKSLGRSVSRKIKTNSSHTTSVATNGTGRPAFLPVRAPPSRSNSTAAKRNKSPEKLKGKAVKKCKSIKQLFFR